MADGGALDAFSEPVRTWFSHTFPAPTAAQEQGWPSISSGQHSLILAPTGSGKTLTAFLWGIDQLMTAPVPEREARTRLLYISPLRALAVDVEKNLRAPLLGAQLAAERLGIDVHQPTVGMRTGDTPADQRRKLIRNPPDILITTPESLYLMLTSQARETLRSVQWIIVDEIHALAATKRGAHLALSLERLEQIAAEPDGGSHQRRGPQRIGLSATQRPLDEIARFLGGFAVDGETRAARPVSIVDAGVTKQMDVEVVVPVEDMGELGVAVEGPDGEADGSVRRSIWPAMHPHLLELIQQHRSTLVFVNARRLAERLATRLNELAYVAEHGSGDAALAVGDEQHGTPPPPVDSQTGLVRAHHGSLSREKRLDIENQLKSGQLKGLVATSSLELGIDMGAVDLVIQVESPGAVSRGLQRIGRAGHQVGEPSKGKLFPKHRADLIEAAVVVHRMQSGEIEHTSYPRNPIDVLAQQIVAMCALDEWSVDDVADLVRGAANFADLSDDVLHNTLDLLAGRYPSEEFSELRPRIVWDRLGGVIRGRKGAQRLAVTSGGTIPDRGLFGVFLPDGTRVGELDEEMVYESRPGETFLLGASTWRIEDITFERVIVTPAPGQPGKMPFWHGDGPGRPLELGRAIGEFVRTIRTDPEPITTLQADYALDPLAAENLMMFLDEQAEATGAVPDDRTIVVERFRDEIGDWRVCVLSPFGAQVHAPWAMALQHRLQTEWGQSVEMLWSDDGIVLRLPEAIDDVPLDELIFDPDEIADIVIGQLPNTAMFAARFRECAGRALLLPRRRPDQRTPLWQQRQRAANLLSVAAKYPTFPILLEATRECINDVFDVPALRSLQADLNNRKIRMIAVDTPRASPFASSLLFGWIAVYMYEGDAPLAERRATALALDRELLHDLLGAEELRELLDAEVLADLELELQRLVPNRHARDPDELHDLLRILGPLNRLELEARVADQAALPTWIEQLIADRRIIEVSVAGDARVAASDDAARLRDGLGVALPIGLPGVFTDPVPDPLADLVVRYARTHGPFLAEEIAARYGAPVDRIRPVLDRLTAEGTLVRGEFRPGGVDREWCDDDVLRQLRRRSLAALRREVEPVDGETLARFLPQWQGVGVPRRGPDGLAEVIATLQGAALPASVLERDILPARMASYRPADLDALCTSGDVVWVGAGTVGAKDGRVRLVFRDQAGLLIPRAAEDDTVDPHHQAILEQLAQRGALFWPDIQQAVADADLAYDDPTVLAALWDLVWAGHITNDSLAPLRALASRSRRSSKASGRARRRGGGLRRLGPPEAAGRWSLVAPLLFEASVTEIAHAKAAQLLDRYG
ncbi:MAG: DEAD/DEAH box helicase, partial [Acidimicrobiales bacterium]|nr:DEAD/DEAH box helicase [Acidimicrobiales bacterium]